MMRRIDSRTLARIFLPLFVVWSLLVPVNSYAFVFPPGVIPPPAFVETAVTGGPLAVAIGTLTVGAVVGYVLVGAVFGDDSTDAVRVQVSKISTAEPPVPYAPATGSYRVADASPVSGTSYLWYCNITSQTCTTSDIATSCYSWASSHSYTFCADTSNPFSGTGHKAIFSNATVNLAAASTLLPSGTSVYNLSGSCSAGYMLSGSTCNLSSAREAVIDHKQDVLLTGSGSSTALSLPLDMDTPAVVDGSKIVPILRGDGTNLKTSYIPGHDSLGRPIMVEVAVSADGSTNYVTQYTQDDSTGQSQVQSKQVVIDAASGVITAVQNNVQVGTLAVPVAGTLTQAITAAPSAATTPTVLTISAMPQQQMMSIPTDYARQGEAATAATTVVTKLTTGIKIDEGSPTLMTAPDPSTLVSPDVGRKSTIETLSEPSIGFSWLPSLWPGSPVTCHALTFRGLWSSSVATMDASYDLDLCPYLGMVREILGWLFSVASVIYIWRRFMTARVPGVS